MPQILDFGPWLAGAGAPTGCDNVAQGKRSAALGQDGQEGPTGLHLHSAFATSDSGRNEDVPRCRCGQSL